MANEFNAGDIIALIGGPVKYWVQDLRDEYYILRKPYYGSDSTITGDRKYIEENYVKVDDGD